MLKQNQIFEFIEIDWILIKKMENAETKSIVWIYWILIRLLILIRLFR